MSPDHLAGSGSLFFSSLSNRGLLLLLGSLGDCSEVILFPLVSSIGARASLPASLFPFFARAEARIVSERPPTEWCGASRLPSFLPSSLVRVVICRNLQLKKSYRSSFVDGWLHLLNATLYGGTRVE